MNPAACGVALLVAAISAAPVPAAEASTAQVSFLEGKARKSRGHGAHRDLRVGVVVSQGDTIETQDATRLEIRFSDAADLRLGPESRLQLTEAHFSCGAARRKITASELPGRLSAKCPYVCE